MYWAHKEGSVSIHLCPLSIHPSPSHSRPRPWTSFCSSAHMQPHPSRPSSHLPDWMVSRTSTVVGGSGMTRLESQWRAARNWRRTRKQVLMDLLRQPAELRRRTCLVQVVNDSVCGEIGGVEVKCGLAC